ncbi:MAG: ribose-phosphate pyrophosphokinase [Ruminococcaceae bacterium]|nr:ribose-phosphate pyrophosphokinase [Oscillospiraceae bacterium]
MSEESFPIGSLALVAMKGFEDFANQVDKWLIDFHKENFGTAPDTFILKSRCPRFANGEGKGIIDETVRGKDLYILTDVGNYSVTYPIVGMTNHMSPDDHYQDLKRIICAASGKAKRINVIMPLLYNGRQHKRMVRESLDCAESLRELANLGVENIVTFDAHDARVQNAIPHMGFENGAAYYQFIKAMLKNIPDIKFDKQNMVIVSPDEGAIHRNLFYASIFGLDLGVFYKVRDYSRIENGRNPIKAHEYIGGDVAGKDIIVVDDILSSGESMLDIAYELKRRNARRIFSMVTYPLFTNGVEKFDKCYEDGIIDRVISTNLTYRRPELADREWFIEADMTKYVAKIIDSLNYDESLAGLINPAQRVIDLMERVKKGEEL